MFLLTTLLASLVAVHAGPPIWGTLLVTDEECVLTIEGEPPALIENLGYDGALQGPFEPGEEERAQTFLRRFFTGGDLFQVEGHFVVPTVRRLVLPIDDPDTDGFLRVEVELVLPAQGMPRNVTLSWKEFRGTNFEGFEFVPVLIKFPGDIEMISLYPEEPEYIWHSREARPRAVVARPPATAVVTRGIPLLSAGLGALALALGLGWKKTRLGAGTGRGLAVAALLGAWLGRDALQVGSFGAGRAPLPTNEQALEIFDVLLTNLYGAFESPGEDAIYDHLAGSVDAGLIDEVYGAIYESLVLREESGAVCSVDGVEILERTAANVDDGSGITRFDVECEWQVHGSVAHYGHIHRRTNHYRANYGVQHDGTTWRFAEIDIRDHERLDPDEESPSAESDDDSEFDSVWEGPGEDSPSEDSAE